MKKLPLFLFIALLAILPLLRSQAAAAPREKVILDTDMVEAFDDGVAMTMLANAPGIELMGVTCVTGNSWVQDGVAYALRQLEIEGKDIPVAVGMRYPLRPQRHALFELERKLCGMGHDAWLGSLNQPEPKSWEAAYQKRYGKAARFKPISKHAVNFIIDTVRANPNQVTIAAIGPCTNLAAAIRMDPDIVPLIKRIVYMGGSFFKPGNVTPSAEFNWWIDPEAAQIVVRAPFKEQIVFGLDVCEKVIFRKSHYDRLLRTLGRGEQAQLLRQSFPGRRFEADPQYTFYVWDVLAAAAIIDPSIITGEKNCKIDVNTQYGLSYGQSLAYPAHAPEGCQAARIITDVDQEKFWNMVNDKVYWNSLRKQ